VLSVGEPSASDVYDLTIEDGSEFFAGNVLVHNCDEPAKFKDASKGDALDTTWNNLMLGLRLGEHPQVIVTGTPTAGKLVKLLNKHPKAHVTRGRTYDNLDNLAPTFRDEILSRYEGTRLGRQELDGEILEDVEGALWTLELIDEDRVDVAPETLVRVVIAIDPAGGTSEHNDETGIIAAGRDGGSHGYVLGDYSGRYSPQGWALRAMSAYEEHDADAIVCERNYGGDMVESTLRLSGFRGRIDVVNASRGKAIRAEPISGLYEQHRIHHVGGFDQLEDQMVTWVRDSGESPDRMDAMVWAFRELFPDLFSGGREWLESLANPRPSAADAEPPAWSPTSPHAPQLQPSQTAATLDMLRRMGLK
jgi:phage terminase large subunit-like protein